MSETAVCIPNINKQERRKRLLIGVIMFAISLFVLAALLLTGVNRWWRLPLAFLFWGATVGYFQWREKT